MVEPWECGYGSSWQRGQRCRFSSSSDCVRLRPETTEILGGDLGTGDRHASADTVVHPMSPPAVDPYDPPYPDGPLDPDEFPTSPAGMSWLDDDDPGYDDSQDPSSPSSVIPSKPF